MPFLHLQPQRFSAYTQTSLPRRSLLPCYFCSKTMVFLQLQPQRFSAYTQTSLPLRSLLPCHFCISSPSDSQRTLKPRSPSVASSHAISASPAPAILYVAAPDGPVWILEFGFWIGLVFVLYVAAPNGSVWILEFGSWILDRFSLRSLCSGPKRVCLDLDFGSWIGLVFVLYVAAPNGSVWILELKQFGSWILDFGSV